MWKKSVFPFSSLTFKTTLSLKQAFSMKKIKGEHQTKHSVQKRKWWKNGKLMEVKTWEALYVCKSGTSFISCKAQSFAWKEWVTDTFRLQHMHLRERMRCNSCHGYSEAIISCSFLSLVVLVSDLKWAPSSPKGPATVCFPLQAFCNTN